MGCRQCDIITTPKRRPIVFDRKESYGRYTSQSYLNHRLPHRCVLLSAGKAPDHPREIFHQIRRPDCGTAKGILYSHSPAIKTEKRASCINCQMLFSEAPFPETYIFPFPYQCTSNHQVKYFLLGLCCIEHFSPL